MASTGWELPPTDLLSKHLTMLGHRLSTTPLQLRAVPHVGTHPTQSSPWDHRVWGSKRTAQTCRFCRKQAAGVDGPVDDLLSKTAPTSNPPPPHRVDGHKKRENLLIQIADEGPRRAERLNTNRPVTVCPPCLDDPTCRGNRWASTPVENHRNLRRTEETRAKWSCIYQRKGAIRWQPSAAHWAVAWW